MTRERHPLWVATIVTALVTVLAYALPLEHAATGVGFAFLAATYYLCLRGDDGDAARRYGLSLGGLFDAAPLDARRLSWSALTAVGWALLLAALIFPAFWVGWLAWWRPPHPFEAAPLAGLLEDALGQALVIALPEEAFYRGYLQTALDERHEPRLRVLGARVGPGLLLASLWFALGHVATETHASRLAVFFPSLVFGWLRARTGGVGAPLAFHALCNLFASFLARSYGLAS